MKKISNCVSNIIKNFNNGEFEEFYKVHRNWKNIIGVEFSQFTRVKDIKKGVAIIEIDHSSGMTLIEMDKENILKRLQMSYPELYIQKINIFLKTAGAKTIKKEEIKLFDIKNVDKSPMEDQEFKKLLDTVNKLGD